MTPRSSKTSRHFDSHPDRRAHLIQIVALQALAKLVRRDLNIDVHPRTIERAVKKTLR